MTIRPLFIGLYDTGLLGIRYLSASLKKHNYDSHIVFVKTFNSYAANEPTEMEYSLLQQTIKEIQPSYIGISIMSSFYLSVVERIVKDIRKNFPETTIIIGGVYATLFPEECLKLADVVFRGECEEAIVEFTDAFKDNKSFEALDNVVIQTFEGVRINPMRDLKKEISNIPHPDFGGNNMYYINNDQVSKGDPRAKTHSYELRTSRGCPNRCSYCSSSSIRDLYKGKGPFIRQREVDDVIQELIAVKQRNQGLQLLRFWDDIFPWNKEWVAKFSAEYKKNIALPFEIWGHPRLSGNVECLKSLVEAGLSKIVVGIQSGCPNIRKNIYTRHETQEEILNCSRAIAEAKVPIVIYDFILGHPFETVDDLKTTLELCRNISKPFKLQLHGLSFLPGTPIEQIAIDHGVKTKEEILEEHAQPLREQYHQNHWWRQGHGQKQDNEKSYWYTLIYLTQFSTGEYVIRHALKNEKLKQNPRRLIMIQRLYNFRLTLQMGFRKLGFLVRRKLRL